ELAAVMAAEPERYERLGDIDLELALVMGRGSDDAFRVRLSFHGITCDGATEIAAGEEAAADCWLGGDLADWQAMFDNITEYGRAVGDWTLNTLTLFGDRISLHATDPLGEDRFHRVNQTLQDFVDGAARLPANA
ncbi:MAG TPA: hypothetical protein VEZ15_05360, partial [Acidimicrobiia bacterium]|nr:hypothetical protein [Acidimicrobiia bacterium]